MRSSIRTVLCGIGLLLFFSNGLLAETVGFVYTISSDSFSTFQNPSGTEFHPTSINDLGQIVGLRAEGTNSVWNGFLFDGSTFTSLEYPGAYHTGLSSINKSGQIVGSQASVPQGGRAFLKSGNSFTSFDFPGAIYTYANGINNLGQIVGSIRIEVTVDPNTVQDFDHGLMMVGTTVNTFDVPGSTSTEGRGINDSGQIVGSYYDGVTHGFIKNGDSYTTVDVPGSTDTELLSINNSGVVLGAYHDSNHKRCSFLFDGSTFTFLPEYPRPDGVDFMEYTGINNVGQLVGDFVPTPHFVPDPNMLP